MSLTIDESAIKRIKDYRAEKGQENLMLRITVEGGGCSGFQYSLEFTEERREYDLIFDDVILTDDISLRYIEGSTIKFKEELIGSDFAIDNPNAQSGCGCGASFSI